MGAKPHWFYRHAVATVVACGLIGGMLGIAFAASYTPKDVAFHLFDALGPIGFLAVSGGGVLIGLLAGILLVRAGRSGTECPRCGTLNPEGTVECSACGLSLA